MQVIRYGQDHWDAARIEAEINQAADWAKQRGVPLICNEFGVFRDFSDPQDRAAWIKDVRTVAGAPQHRLGDVGLLGQLRRGHRTARDEGQAG